LLAAALLLIGCSGDTSTRDESVAEIYAVAIQWLLDDGGVAAGTTDERVFIEAVGDEPIPLEVQADVVNRLEDSMVVRFIDARDEAIDTSMPGDPVREGGFLIGLELMTDAERQPVHLYADRYRDVRHVVAYELALDRRGGDWQVTGTPERVSVDDARRAPGD
jgi:hypothetical protein